MQHHALRVPFRASLIGKTSDVRVTQRCVVEDLGLPEDADIADVLESPVGLRAVDQALSFGADAAGGSFCEVDDVSLWADDSRPVVWVLAIADEIAAVRERLPRRAR